MITTAGFDRHSVCYEMYDYAKKVSGGIIEDLSFFSFIAEVEAEADWHDQELWSSANPSLGATIDGDSLLHDYREAVDSVTKENRFRRYRLNQWTEQDMRWLKMEKWEACAGSVDPAELEGSSTERLRAATNCCASNRCRRKAGQTCGNC